MLRCRIQGSQVCVDCDGYHLCIDSKLGINRFKAKELLLALWPAKDGNGETLPDSPEMGFRESFRVSGAFVGLGRGVQGLGSMVQGFNLTRVFIQVATSGETTFKVETDCTRSICRFPNELAEAANLQWWNSLYY